MAQVSMIKVVCDQCGSATEVSKYEVRSMERRVTLDLCSECAAPLELLLTNPKASAVRHRARGVPDARRATIEEIEALKRKP